MNMQLMAAVTSPLDGVNVTKLCKTNGVTPKTFYKWRKRYLEEGLDGLYERSRKPAVLANKLPDDVADLVIKIRHELTSAGKDNGPGSIHDALVDRRNSVVPSEATIWRILKDANLIVDQPQKKPKAATRRFESALPNETWQIDATEWRLSRGRKVWIFNIIDDHSRLLINSVAVFSATTEEAWKAFSQGIKRWGLPLRCLSDNGLAFTGRLNNYVVYFEEQLREAGIKPVNSRPYHPQTCGKVERFQQTLKRWLKAQPTSTSLVGLQAQLDEFAHYYNYERRHRGIGRMTPHARWSGQQPVTNDGVPIETPTRRSQSLCAGGVVSAGKYRIGIGLRYDGEVADIAVDSRRALVFIEGRLIKALEIDTSRAYQPSGLGRTGKPRKAS